MFIEDSSWRDTFRAIKRDDNDNMVLIALAVIQVEYRDNWKRFLRELLDDIEGLGHDIQTFIF